MTFEPILPNPAAGNLQVDLRQMVLALGTTVDLVGINDPNHGKRVGYIASQLAYKLGFDATDLNYIFELGLLHDCGVSNDEVHNALINHFDWEQAYVHCEIGYQLLKDFKPLSRLALPIRYHHTPWATLTGLREISPEERNLANLIFLADRIDVLGAAHYGKDILLVRDDILESVREHSGNYFDPDMVDAFADVQRSEAFWITLEDRHITRYAWDVGRLEEKRTLSLAELRQLSLIFAYIVDQKSSFTASHSARVGVLARHLAELAGLSRTRCDKVEIAGFLHDIGKLRTPDYILEKPGALSPAERAVMNQHSYETYEILRYIEGLGDIAQWAAYHHEGLNGSGYPFHPKEGELGTEARVIAVADVFQALAQDRPYRDGMALCRILSILDELVESGQLDGNIVAMVHRDQDSCLAFARGEAERNRIVERELFPHPNVPLSPPAFVQTSV